MNTLSVFFDVFILLSLSLLITKGHIRATLLITQAITLLWSFVNTFYGRFFYQYLPLSAIGEINGLQESLVIESTLSGFKWFDFYYLVSCLFFIYQFKRIKIIKLNIHNILYILLIPIISLLITLSIYTTYHFILPKYRYNWELYLARNIELLGDIYRGGTPNLSYFQIGCIRSTGGEFIDLLINKKLTEDQKQIITRYCNESSKRYTKHSRNSNIQNVVFILLESFLSSPIDLHIEGKEVTPYLNSLKKDSKVYYNGMMKSDITCGESGDGQFIYMTGILPLRNRITVSKIKGKSLPALPKILEKELNIGHSNIYNPAGPNLWQQSDMNLVYGITSMYCNNDIISNKPKVLEDKDIFTFAASHIRSCKVPFFSLILSVSTHSPYDKFFGEDLFSNNKIFSEEYQNYLNTCHYTDKQVGYFISKLKETDIYDHSLIIITADHHAHLDALKMESKITNHIPLFIINGQIDNKNAYHGEIRQLDVFTTLLDILNINSRWKGLGHTILSPNYANSVNENAYKISEMIIEGDYFE